MDIQSLYQPVQVPFAVILLSFWIIFLLIFLRKKPQINLNLIEVHQLGPNDCLIISAPDSIGAGPREYLARTLDEIRKHTGANIIVLLDGFKIRALLRGKKTDNVSPISPPREGGQKTEKV
jgi:hypothetical protein